MSGDARRERNAFAPARGTRLLPLRRLLLAGAAALLLLSLAVWALGEHTRRGVRGDLETHAAQYWDALLTAHYDRFGGWAELAGTLPAMPSGAGLLVFDAQGDAIYAAGDADGQPVRPLLLRGEAVGGFAFRMSPADERFTSASAMPALLVFAGGAAFLALLAWRIGVPLAAARRRADKLAAELEASRTKLRKLERVRSSMVADVAHELRNPLSTMRTVTENALAAGQPISPERAAVLLDEMYRMSKLVGDLNELALAESGHLQLEKSWFSLTELLQTIVDAMLPEAELRGLALVLTADSSSPLLFADRVRLQQVFVNLLANALRHARHAIELRLADEAGSGLTVTVADDGQGIDEDELPHIFDRFYRSRERSGGSGLGLAIVQEFTRAHGGQVEAESRWGEGAAFTVRLPAFRE